jgi:hypothetical protein
MIDEDVLQFNTKKSVILSHVNSTESSIGLAYALYVIEVFLRLM